MPKATKLGPYKPLIRAQLAFDKRRASLGRNRFITFSGRSDGIGAQIHAICSLHAYAHLRGLTYLNSPMTQIAHGDGSPSWDEDWNRFFNIPLTPETPVSACDSKPLKVNRALLLKDNTVYHCNRAHPVVDLFPESYSAVMPSLRKAYDDAPKEKCHVYTSGPEVKKIALHARKGDAAGHQSRESNLDSLKAKLLKIEKSLSQQGVDYEIHLFSQGTPADFAALKDRNVHFHLNTDLFETFHSLVTADVFVMARSSLSYAAALLNQNAIFYEPFWHPRLPRWRVDN